MRFDMPLSEPAMVAHFLRTELHSSRFGDSIRRLLARDGIDLRVVEQPDLTSPSEDRQRAALLGEFRGYRRNADVFTGMPDDVRWRRTVLDRADLERLLYIDDDYWTDFSGGSRLVSDAARRIIAGALPEAAAGYLSLARTLAGGIPFPEMIVLHNPLREELVVLEGHVRATAHLLHQKLSLDAPSVLPVLVGISNRLAK